MKCWSGTWREQINVWTTVLDHPTIAFTTKITGGTVSSLQLATKTAPATNTRGERRQEANHHSKWDPQEPKVNNLLIRKLTFLFLVLELRLLMISSVTWGSRDLDTMCYLQQTTNNNQSDDVVIHYMTKCYWYNSQSNQPILLLIHCLVGINSRLWAHCIVVTPQ